MPFHVFMIHNGLNHAEIHRQI